MADAGADSGSSKPPIDAWLVHDDDASAGGLDVEPWRAMLEAPSLRAGLAKLALTVWRGRKSWGPLRTIACSDAKGERVEGPTQQAKFDVDAHLDVLRRAVQDNHDFHKHRRYRLTFWVVKKKGAEPEVGEGRTLLIGDDGDSTSEEPFSAKMAEQHLKLCDLQQKIIGTLTNSLDAYARVSMASQVTAMEHQRDAMAVYREANEYGATLRSRPSPQDVTDRIKTVANSKPLEIFAGYAGQAVNAWVMSKLGGVGVGMPPPTPPGAPSEPSPEQTKIRDLFEGLSSEQKDKLRDGLGADVFGDIVSIIHGTPQAWAQHRQNVAACLRGHAMLLMQILTPEQMQVLQSL